MSHNSVTNHILHHNKAKIQKFNKSLIQALNLIKKSTHIYIYNFRIIYTHMYTQTIVTNNPDYQYIPIITQAKITFS